MKYYVLVLVVFIGQWACAQNGDAIDGPVIFDYGATYEIKDPDFIIDSDQNYHVIFDINEKNKDPERINRSLNTVARFINMHANEGIGISEMKIVVVIHGTASNDIMDDDFHNDKYGVDNPNLDLVEKLQDAGVEFYLCGQTMHSRNLTRNQILDDVKLALSAMTVNNHFASKGYIRL